MQIQAMSSQSLGHVKARSPWQLLRFSGYGIQQGATF